MSGPGKFIAIAILIVVAGCGSHEVHGVIGEPGDAFAGQLVEGSGGRGRIEINNAKGMRCIGEYSGARSGASTALKVAGALIGGPAAYAAIASSGNSSGGAGRGLMTCNDGQQAVIQFTSLSGSTGYGFGTTDRGQPIRFTYGLSQQDGAQYISTQPAPSPGGSGSGGPSQPTRSGSGTGFFITRQGHILTNAHVVEGCKTLTAARISGAAVEASIVSLDKQNDLAVLMASPSPAVAGLRNGRPVRQGEPVVAYGFPYAGSLSSGGSITTGSVNALSGLKDDTRYFQISAPVQPGNSGGPLLDNTGAVVGVVSSGLRGRGSSQPQNVNFAIKVDVVRTFLAAGGITADNASASRELSTPDIGEKARAFTVLIECGA